MAESGRVISGGGGPTPLGTNPGGKYISRGGAMSRTQVGSTSSVAEVRNSTPILAASIAGMATRRRQPQLTLRTMREPLRVYAVEFG